MDKYIYLILGVIFGIAVAIYYMARREEKIENKINDVKRELTEDEKNEIIVECYKEEFKV